jgi:hypothetical protein
VVSWVRAFKTGPYDGERHMARGGIEPPFKEKKPADPLPEPISEEDHKTRGELSDVIEVKFLYAMI